MAEIEIFTSQGKPVLRYDGRIKEMNKGRNKNIKDLLMDTVRFYAREKNAEPSSFVTSEHRNMRRVEQNSIWQCTKVLWNLLKSLLIR